VAEPGQTVEFLTWKARVTSEIGRPELVAGPAGSDAAVNGHAGDRRSYFAGHGWLPTPLHRGEELGAGARIEGPAIVAEPTSTLVLPPGSSATVTNRGNYLVEVN